MSKLNPNAVAATREADHLRAGKTTGIKIPNGIVAAMLPKVLTRNSTPPFRKSWRIVLSGIQFQSGSGIRNRTSVKSSNKVK